MAKRAEIWVCDICRKQEEAELFPKHWFVVEVTSGSYLYGEGDNRNICKGCCSINCIKLALEKSKLLEEK